MGQARNEVTASWVPDSCTLPTVDRPLRLAGFDGLFAGNAQAVDRVDDRTARIELDADAAVAAQVADLAVRESSCCSFFTFMVKVADGRLFLDIEVPAAHVPVLDALAARAAASMTGDQA